MIAASIHLLLDVVSAALGGSSLLTQSLGLLRVSVNSSFVHHC